MADTLLCPACGTCEVSVDAESCPACRARVRRKGRRAGRDILVFVPVRSCPLCGHAEVPLDAVRCDGCGARVTRYDPEGWLETAGWVLIGGAFPAGAFLGSWVSERLGAAGWTHAIEGGTAAFLAVVASAVAGYFWHVRRVLRANAEAGRAWFSL